MQMKMPLLTLMFLMLFCPLLAQGSKTGYVDLDGIYAQMPETKQLQLQLDADKVKLKKELDNKQNLLKQKTQAFYATFPPAAGESPNAAEPDLTARKSLYEESKQLAEQMIKDKKKGEEALLIKENQQQALIIEKIKSAVGQVVAEKGYATVQPLKDALYYNLTDDLTSAVRAKLGLPIPNR